MNISDQIFLTECPRDAIQAIRPFISTEKKIRYNQLLLDSGLFDVLDFGSFVSKRAVPQMADSGEVASGLKKNSRTKLLAVVAHEDGATEACQHENIDYIGYPFSISEQFQLRNTRSTIAASFLRVDKLQETAGRTGQNLVVYLSMAFGNPYGDPWSIDLVLEWIERIGHLGIEHFSIADTTGEGDEKRIQNVLRSVLDSFPSLHFSAHLHSRPEEAAGKISAAREAGCRHFEGAMLGFGGCPFAQDHLVGNIPSEELILKFRPPENQIVGQLQQAFNELINT